MARKGGHYKPEDFGLPEDMLDPTEERSQYREEISDAKGRAAQLAEIVTNSAANPRVRRSALEQQVMPYVLEGYSYEEISEILELTPGRVSHVVQDALRSTRSKDVETLRAIENGRLDRAQMAIWADVKAGDLKAVNTFLKISQRRAQLNGLDAPIRVEMSVDMRETIASALGEMEEVLLEDEPTAPRRELDKPEQNLSDVHLEDAEIVEDRNDD